MVIGISSDGGAVTGGSPVVFSSSDSGIDRNSRGFSRLKKWGIIGAIVLVLILVGVGILVAVTRKDSAAAKDFKELVNYIENVPQDFEWDQESSEEEKNWIYAVLVTNKGLVAVQNYYKELNNKWKEFLDKNGANISSDIIKNYSGALAILENAINYRLKQDELFGEYDDGGAEAAKKYFDEVIKCASEDAGLSIICSAEMDYYESALEEYVNNVESDDIVRLFNAFSGFTAKSILSNSMKKISSSFLEGLGA